VLDSSAKYGDITNHERVDAKLRYHRFGNGGLLEFRFGG